MARMKRLELFSFLRFCSWQSCLCTFDIFGRILVVDEPKKKNPKKNSNSTEFFFRCSKRRSHSANLCAFIRQENNTQWHFSSLLTLANSFPPISSVSVEFKRDHWPFHWFSFWRWPYFSFICCLTNFSNRFPCFDNSIGEWRPRRVVIFSNERQNLITFVTNEQRKQNVCLSSIFLSSARILCRIRTDDQRMVVENVRQRIKNSYFKTIFITNLIPTDDIASDNKET